MCIVLLDTVQNNCILPQSIFKIQEIPFQRLTMTEGAELASETPSLVPVAVKMQPPPCNLNSSPSILVVVWIIDILLSSIKTLKLAFFGRHRHTGPGGGQLSPPPPPPSENEVGQITNIIQAKIGGNNFKKKTYVI
jgi:hypothetical protein